MEEEQEEPETYLMNRKQLTRETEIHYDNNGDIFCRYKKKYRLTRKTNPKTKHEQTYKLKQLYKGATPEYVKRRIQKFHKTQNINLERTKITTNLNKSTEQKKRKREEEEIEKERKNHEIMKQSKQQNKSAQSHKNKTKQHQSLKT